MEALKCNLYIQGNPGVGKSFFRRTLEELIHFERKSSMDKFNGYDWIIRTENIQIEVEIKEYRNSEFTFIPFESTEAKNIIFYITNEYEHKLDLSIPQKDIEQLKSLSNKALIIIATPLLRPYELNRKFNFSYLKKIIPFVEYFIPIYDFHYREYENFFQTGNILRQIIINSYPHALKHAKELIRLNLETEGPTLDLGNCGLTSLNEVKELFQNYATWLEFFNSIVIVATFSLKVLTHTGRAFSSTALLFSPHASKFKMIGSKLFPKSVSSYSTLGTLVSKMTLLTKPCNTNSFS
ncbi:hypothetical protein GCM10022209_34680 [Chitinophaga oryziterrae]